MRKKRVALLSSMNPSWFEKKILNFLIVEGFDVIIPLSRKEDQEYLQKGFSKSDFENIHFFNCDFRNLEDSQIFQTYLFEKWYPLDAAFINFDQKANNQSIEELSTSEVADLYLNNILPCFNISKCILPLLNEDDSKVLLFRVIKACIEDNLDYSNQIINSCNKVLASCIEKEFGTNQVAINKFELHISSESSNDFEEVEPISDFVIVFENILEFLNSGNRIKEKFRISKSEKCM